MKIKIFVIIGVILCVQMQGQELLKTIKYAHKMTPNTIAVSDDGSKIVSGGADKYTFIWDAKTGSKLKKLPRNIYSIMAVDISSDNKLVASVGVAKTIDIWDDVQEKYILTDKGHNATITSAEFSPDNKSLATGGYDEKIVLWDIASGNELKVFKHKAKVSDLSFDESGKYLVSVSDNVYLWNVKEGNLINEFNLEKNDSRTVDITSDASLIAVNRNYEILIIDVKTFSVIATFQGHKKQINKLCFTADGKYLFSTGDDKTVMIWNMESKSLTKSFEAHLNYVTNLSVSKNGEILVTCGKDNSINIWNISYLGINAPQFVAESFKESESVDNEKDEFIDKS
ncbi:MAG: WD40 repeat domain-containing protein, partial [Bacteroidota bacterium]